MQPETLKLLFIFAHPDDETFGTGGTIAYYARRGVEVHYICATRGEVGEAPPDLRGYKSVGEMREAELKCAADILGIHAIHFLNYRDSGMPGSTDNTNPNAFAAQPTELIARQIASLIREIRPQVIVTFDPIGGYLHPDHIAAHNATLRAYEIAADEKENLDGRAAHRAHKLYYSTFSRRFLRAVIRAMRLIGRDPRKFGTNNDIDITKIAEHDFPIHARVPVNSVAAIKQEAFKCHASQVGGMGRGARVLQRFLDRNETFMRALPAEPPARVEKDLFEGI
ncbi:MAG: PIG-L family deacetylase [Chloroflexi bacterium]|nr:PIG-L family deacetylase [Chloroflexota bacterium]